MKHDISPAAALARAQAAGALAPEPLRPAEGAPPRLILYACCRYALYHNGLVARLTRRSPVLVLDRRLVGQLTAGLSPADRPAPVHPAEAQP